MPEHNLNAAQAYIVCIWPFLLGSLALYAAAVLGWCGLQTWAEVNR